MSTQKPLNPFFTGTDIPDRYFCDRQKETAEIIKHIENGSNIVLKAPRRLGKSSLIKHVFAQDKIARNYNTLYVDIYGTMSAYEFEREMQNRFMAAPFARATKTWKTLASYAKGLQVNLGSYNGMSVELPSIGLGATPNPVFTINEIFDEYERSDKPGLIVFDEFQQIENYPERMAAILRSKIQELNNTKFIFSGSSRHILSSMFLNYNQPFYRSAVTMDLDIIGLESYREFAKAMFEDYGRIVDDDAVDFVYYLMSGNTFNMQETMKEMFMMTSDKGHAKKDDAVSAVLSILDRHDEEYREQINLITNLKDRKLLYCVAKEGIAQNLTSGGIMKRYGLDNASSVQHSISNLTDEKMPLIQRLSKTYMLQDRIFELWLSLRNGGIEDKFKNPKERFDRERALNNELQLKTS
jgi:AAA+ ATPase superfamily predicted ATPase